MIDDRAQARGPSFPCRVEEASLADRVLEVWTAALFDVIVTEGYVPLSRRIKQTGLLHAVPHIRGQDAQLLNQKLGQPDSFVVFLSLGNFE